MVPLQAFLTCVGNVTAAYAAFRIARSEGWKPQTDFDGALAWLNTLLSDEKGSTKIQNKLNGAPRQESQSLVGFEDLGNALKGDTDFSFVAKLFVGCAVASYAIKYGEVFFDFPYDANVLLGLAVVAVPSALNAYKWYKRGLDPTFGKSGID